MDKALASLLANPRVAAALDHIDRHDRDTLADMEAVTSIAAPSGNESARGEWLAGRLREAGLTVQAPDAVGNVCALRPGSDDSPPVVLAAHLDTVFPADTDLTVRHTAGRMESPGIGDNGRGIAALVRIACALHGAAVSTSHPILFVGTVGEEGAGDLRGVKHLFADLDAAAFIALDGAGADRIVNRAVGSRRLRVTCNGPGGHSWVDRGTANPVHALASAIAAVTGVARYPESSLSVGRIEGGTGVNVIPARAVIDVDIRSESGAEIHRIEVTLRQALDLAVREANGERATGTRELDYDVVVTGDRPGGETPVESDIVQAAIAATTRLGCDPELSSSSTDANVPISLGIPSVAIGGGGETGGMHTTAEWYSNKEGAAGIKRALLLALLIAT